MIWGLRENVSHRLWRWALGPQVVVLLGRSRRCGLTWERSSLAFRFQKNVPFPICSLLLACHRCELLAWGSNPCLLPHFPALMVMDSYPSGIESPNQHALTVIFQWWLGGRERWLSWWSSSFGNMTLSDSLESILKGGCVVCVFNPCIGGLLGLAGQPA